MSLAPIEPAFVNPGKTRCKLLVSGSQARCFTSGSLVTYIIKIKSLRARLSVVDPRKIFNTLLLITIDDDDNNNDDNKWKKCTRKRKTN